MRPFLLGACPGVLSTAAITAVVAILVGQLAPVAIASPLSFINVPLTSFPVPPNVTMSPSVMSVASAPDGNIYFSIQWPMTATQQRSLARFRPSDGVVSLIMAGDGMCTPGADVPGPSMPLSTRPSLTMAASDQMLVTIGMPAAQVLFVGLWGPNPTVARIVGAPCDFVQAPWAIAGSGASVTSHLPPPNAARYRPSTKQLFISTQAGVVVATDGFLSSFYGNLSDTYRDVDDIARPAVRPNRLSARTRGCGDLELLGDAFLLVPENSLATVSLVDFSTGEVTFAVSSDTGYNNWPPPYPCLLTGGGCDARNFSLYGAGGVAAIGTRILYVASSMFPAVYRIDLSTFTITLAGGNVPAEVAGFPTVMPAFKRVRSIAIAASGLYLSTDIGLLRAAIAADGPANLPTPPAAALCQITTDCAPNRARAVTGLPATGCICVCVNSRFFGPRCNLTKTATHTMTPTVRVVPPPIPPVIITPTVTIAIATVTTTTVVISVVTPSMGTQGGRSIGLLQLAQCTSLIDSPMDFTHSPTDATIGRDGLRFFFGAVAGNLGIVFGVVALHYVVTLLYQTAKHITSLEASTKLRFPSVATFPLLFTIEGTTYAATALVVAPSATITHRVVGAVVVAGVLAFYSCVAIFLKFYFTSTFVLYEAHETDIPPAVSYVYFRSLARKLLDETGKWRDERTGQPKRLGGLFAEYRDGVHAFILFEFGLSIATGILAALKPMACATVVILIVFAFLGYLLGVVALRPAISRFQNMLLIFVATLQTLSAFLSAVSVYTDDDSLDRTAGTVTTAAMFVVAVGGLCSAAERVWLIIKYMLCRDASTDRRRHAISNSTFAAISDPIAPMHDGLEMGLLRPAGGTNPSEGSRRDSSNPSILATLGREESATVNPFANFSFTNNPGDRAVSPPPRIVADAGPGVEPVARSARIDALRRELEDLMSGRTADGGQRFDALLADAQAAGATTGSQVPPPSIAGSFRGSFARQGSSEVYSGSGGTGGTGTTQSSHRSSATRQSSSAFGSAQDLHLLGVASAAQHRRSNSNLSFTSALAAAAAAGGAPLPANRSLVAQSPSVATTTTTTSSSGASGMRRRAAIDPQMLL